MRVHFIAIGGAIMHQLAIALHRKGFQVTGSDDEINNPSKSNLEAEGLLPAAFGWFPEKITADIDEIILGMHAKADNPELIKAKELGLKIFSFPEFIYRRSESKLRVVVAGSHGKTTTTSMIMHVLKNQNIDFDYLVGAKVEGFDLSVRISDAPIIILEGDEYPASVIEKRPKIHFYKPSISVLTGIAWDHINVFPTYQNYLEQFSIYLETMQHGHKLIYNAEDKEVVQLVEKHAEHLKQIPYATPSFNVQDGELTVKTSNGWVPLQIFGSHNLQNMEAARKVCVELGIEEDTFYTEMKSFTGAARRLEKIMENETLVAYRDFAHAPSKLRATLKAARERYPNRLIVACFELHTFSSLNNAFLQEYEDSMNDCDAACVFYSAHALALKNLPPLDKSEIKRAFDRNDLVVLDEKEALQSWITTHLFGREQNVCLLMMSSGTFDGLDFEFIK